jgi:hypothetical protein
MGQFGLFDADKRLAALSAKGDPLEAIDRLVPWESFRVDIEAVVLTRSRTDPAASGRGDRRSKPAQHRTGVAPRPYAWRRRRGACPAPLSPKCPHRDDLYDAVPRAGRGGAELSLLVVRGLVVRGHPPSSAGFSSIAFGWGTGRQPCLGV